MLLLVRVVEIQAVVELKMPRYSLFAAGWEPAVGLPTIQAGLFLELEEGEEEIIRMGHQLQLLLAFVLCLL